MKQKRNKIRIVSLFSGIGGFEEGIRFSKLDADVVFASEIDEYAKKSYSANFDSTVLVGDITKINEKDIPNHDLLLAGFPCQSFSIAGSMKGFDDVRGTLFFDIVRILKEKKPKYFLLENVKNLVSHDDGNTINIIIHNLNDLGYTIDFAIIDSAESGVPQSRNRTYIVGILDEKKELYQEDCRTGKISQLKAKFNAENINSFNFFNYLEFKCKKQSLVDILEDNVNEKFYFKTDKINNYLNENKFEDINDKRHEIVKLFEMPRTVHNDLDRQRRVYSTYGISPTVLARIDSTKIYQRSSRHYSIRKITPSENFYVQGFSKGFVNNIKSIGMSEGRMYKQSGNAVSPPVITGIVNLLYDNYISKD